MRRVLVVGTLVALLAVVVRRLREARRSSWDASEPVLGSLDTWPAVPRRVA